MKPSFDVLCIMRNSARTLPLLFKSLERFQQSGGHVVITDTGSTDDSVELARSLGAEVTEAGERFMHTIDADTAKAINERFIVDGEEPIVEAGGRYFHFAEARNFTLDLATNDWVTWIDSDEAYVRLDIDKINEAMADESLAHLEYNFCYAWQRPPNLDDPNDFGIPGVEFVQSKTMRRLRMNWGNLPVHELITPLPNPAPGGFGRRLLPREHFYLGHWQEPSDHRVKYAMGLAVACFEEPNHDRESHYHGRELCWTGRPKSAIKEFQRHVAMNGWAAERAESFAFMGDCYGQIGDTQNQVEAYHKCFAADPTRRIGLLRLASYYKSISQPHACAAFASAALEIPHHPFYAANMREYRALPYELRYWARGWQGNVAGAQEDILKVLTMEPFNPEANRDVQFFFDYDTNTAPDGWMVAPEMLWLHDNAKGKKRILEVGSWKGRSTHALCTGAGKTGGTVYAVDHFGGSSEAGDQTHGADAEEVFRQFTSNTAQFQNLVVHRTASLEAADQYPEGFFDALFVDASHDYASVKADLLKWRSKVGGLFCGHDFSDTWPGVKAAVREVVGDPDGVCCSIWWKKVEAPPANPLLLYMTQMLREGKPVSFVKRGDGEEAAMAGEVGANCDGHPYSQELGQKLKMAFWGLEKMMEPREGRTWVNVVPFKDQPFYNILLARPDQNFDAVKAFWGAIRESDAHKVFVGPQRLAGVAGLLKAGTFIEIPLVNAFAEYDAIKEKLMCHTKSGAIFVFCAGMPAKAWICQLLGRQPKLSCIDAGSAFDPLFLDQPSRTMQLPRWLLEREYAEWMK